MSSIDSINIAQPGPSIQLSHTTGEGSGASSRTAAIRPVPAMTRYSYRARRGLRRSDRVSAMASQSRGERIEQLRASVQAGTYNVSGADIASKMIGLNG